MTDKPTLHIGVPERRIVYAWEGEVDELRAEIERLRATLTDLRERSVEEGIHHFVSRIDAALRRPMHD